MRINGRPGSIVGAAGDQPSGPAGDRLLDRIGAYDSGPHGEADEGMELSERPHRLSRLGPDLSQSNCSRRYTHKWCLALVPVEVFGQPV
jgi:hypothetical protein